MPPLNDLPNPYKTVNPRNPDGPHPEYFKMPAGWGATGAAGGGARGAGAAAAGRARGAAGAAGGQAGAGRGPAGPVGAAAGATKGHQVFKFDKDGKLLLTLGKPGGAADPDFF